MAKKHCGKRRKCWLPAFSPFPTMFSVGLFFRVIKSRVKCGKGLSHLQLLSNLTFQNFCNLIKTQTFRCKKEKEYKIKQEHCMWVPTLCCVQNVKSFCTTTTTTNVKAIAMPQVFTKNSPAKKGGH